MKFKDEIRGDIGVLSMKGKLMGPPESDELHTEVRSLLGQRVKKIVLDMGGVTWINSMGVGAIMRCYTSIMNSDGKLAIANPAEKVKYIFSMIRLMELFNVTENVEDAIAKL
jgi:anti-sigma B factor antagonist